ncbi:hypothetical protein WA158_003895 [Blastocystis sp. Blastoise]
MSTYKKTHSLEERKEESELIRKRWPKRTPVICEKDGKSSVPTIEKQKFLVPAEMTVAEFIFTIRKRISLTPNTALFIFINNKVPSSGATIASLYEKNKDQDGFLYITYSGENTFGI